LSNPPKRVDAARAEGFHPGWRTVGHKLDYVHGCLLPKRLFAAPEQFGIMVAMPYVSQFGPAALLPRSPARVVVAMRPSDTRPAPLLFADGVDRFGHLAHDVKAIEHDPRLAVRQPVASHPKSTPSSN
jgi:hypothetical protein